MAFLFSLSFPWGYCKGILFKFDLGGLALKQSHRKLVDFHLALDCT